MSSELFGTFHLNIAKPPLGHKQSSPETRNTLRTMKRAKQRRRYLPFPLRYSYSIQKCNPDQVIAFVGELESFGMKSPPINVTCRRSLCWRSVIFHRGRSCLPCGTTNKLPGCQIMRCSEQFHNLHYEKVNKNK